MKKTEGKRSQRGRVLHTQRVQCWAFWRVFFYYLLLKKRRREVERERDLTGKSKKWWVGRKTRGYVRERIQKTVSRFSELRHFVCGKRLNREDTKVPVQQKFGRRRLHYPSIQLLYSFFAGRPPFCFCFRFYYLQSANGDKVYYSVPSPPPSTLSIPSPAHSYIVSYPFPPSVKTGHGIKLPVNSVIHLLVAAFLSSS